MRIVIKYFSVLRDITGKIREELDLKNGTSMSQLIEWFFKTYPKAEVFREELLILVNGRTVDNNYILKDGDEVAFMPPVSGGGKIIQGSLDLNREVADIIGKTALQGGGGVVIFVGYVKGKVNGAWVNTLEYEAYEPYASFKIDEIEKWAREQEGVLDVRIYHVVGSLKPGDTTIYVFVSAINRDIAFKVAREALERVKHEVPIFKLERRDDGEFWVLGDGKRVPRSPQS
ncbi:molybdopterin synthase subunit MoaD / molybdopterin synthase subunit MoaE [Pyrobaculum islandicum DSM 4184]|uniref:Molybdopterin synthase subunit MoaD / molybdopterin synthase subunit MoaE n=1 Tax=Pyrobaculum islandicum (strain DSM 4184 / JCM 9189 / GEO3) TaxID=384616 RepID=A1RS95_PYRIL|nr:MoaD family protein [Pyrobaculum islandicum]ABL87827.1 molybdopterin synthase subunit MoaD / molybdopterin synthase subunit MoaE [Pyrobaculum islandicum DSM 4184]